MCGIAGLVLASEHPQAPHVLGEMLHRIQHRGPDSAGSYSASIPGEQTVHLGFRRLAIRDLDPRANQPMVSSSGRTAIVFNGEVYNSEALAAQYLEHHTRRTSGDTEVLLEVIEREGIQAVEQFNGMFALAILDTESGRVWLTRDRMGKKPLYLYEREGLLAFGSELRCLRPFGSQLNPRFAELFLHFGYVPAPFTMFTDTTQVAPGEIVEVSRSRIIHRSFYHRFSAQPWSRTDCNFDRLQANLHDAVQIRTISDVPLGSFLSGGIDSALVAANLRDVHAQPREAVPASVEPGDSPTGETPTFTVAFAERVHNEADAAAETARELGLPHTVIQIDEKQLPELAESFLDCYEQPYADTSGLVTMLLCRAVKQHVTVALSGDGGDEFFGGYTRYLWFRQALLAQRFPGLLRQFAAGLTPLISARRGERIARWLNADDPASLYAAILRNWNATEISSLIEPMDAPVGPVDLVRHVFENTDADPLSQAACFDATYYIPDDLQVKLDRASMQVALEVRCPLLDYRVAGEGLAMRTKAKYQGGPKSTLKACLAQHVPPRVLNRPKHGFNVPLAGWLRGSMSPLLEETLGQRHVRECGWLNTATADRVWEAFKHGEVHQAHHVWMLFNLAHHLRPSQADPRFDDLVRGMSTRRKAA